MSVCIAKVASTHKSCLDRAAGLSLRDLSRPPGVNSLSAWTRLAQSVQPFEGCRLYCVSWIWLNTSGTPRSAYIKRLSLILIFFIRVQYERRSFTSHVGDSGHIPIRDRPLASSYSDSFTAECSHRVWESLTIQTDEGYLNTSVTCARCNICLMGSQVEEVRSWSESQRLSTWTRFFERLLTLTRC